jgi:hypothetical protein
MANFDSFERNLRRALATEDAQELEQAITDILAITDQRKIPGFAKRKEEAEFQGWVNRARAAVRSFFPAGETFTTDNNNQRGKDLLAQKSGRQIEVKSAGSKTDANSGVGPMSWVFGDEDEALLNDIIAGSARRRRALWAETSDEAERERLIEASKQGTIASLVNYFGDRLQVGEAAPARIQLFARAVALGYTKEKEIRAYVSAPKIMAAISESQISADHAPLLLRADWEAGLVPYEQAFDPDEVILVEAIHGGNGARAEVLLRGQKSSLIARLYPHYKNSYGNIPARAWVKNGCFHVWIRRAQ